MSKNDILLELNDGAKIKKTDKWLSALRLQLPSATTKYDSANKITNEEQNVNRILKQR